MTQDKWKYEFTDSQRRTLEIVLRFMHANLDARIKTGSNVFDATACGIARAEIGDLLAMIEI